MLQIGRFNESEKLGVKRERGFSDCAIFFLCRLYTSLLVQILLSPSLCLLRGWIYSVTGVSTSGFYLGYLHKPAVNEEADREVIFCYSYSNHSAHSCVGLCGRQLSSWCALAICMQVSCLKIHRSRIIIASCLAVCLVTCPEEPCWPEMF